MSRRYLLHRFLSVPPIVIGVTIISFALIYLGPVDPITAITPDDATAEQIAMLRHAYGFDRPIPIQYLTWLHRVMTGDFGVSLQTGRPVLELLLPALINTLRLAAVATLACFVVAFGLGVASAVWHRTWLDRVP